MVIEKLDVVYTGRSFDVVYYEDNVPFGGSFDHEGFAHLAAAAEVMQSAIAEFLRWENEREHSDSEWQEATDKLAVALAASRVPEKADD